MVETAEFADAMIEECKKKKELRRTLWILTQAMGSIDGVVFRKNCDKQT